MSCQILGWKNKKVKYAFVCLDHRQTEIIYCECVGK